MRNEEIKAELESLRAEVRALAEARADAAQDRAQEPRSDPASLSVEDGRSDDEPALHDGIRQQIDEVVELLEHEMKESPVVAGVAIFALGILVGRLLR